MEIRRRKTRVVRIGNVSVGGRSPIVVQSMTKTDTADTRKTIKQIKSLEKAGCEIVRVAVPDSGAARALGKIKVSIKIPLVADIHFDHRLALIALEEGVDGLRINPGNIGKRERVEQVVKAALKRKVPIRIGVNAGSIEKRILSKYGRPSPSAMLESALGHTKILEELGFRAIKLSLKASNVRDTVEAYRLAAKETDYPLHLGITEAGSYVSGTIHSAVGIGILLSEGIGDTLRVSLTAPPEREVEVAYEILRALDLRKRGPRVISCPSCGRAEIDVEKLTKQVESKIAGLTSPIDIAIMGCVVNGPGEAQDADIGLAGGKGLGMLFVRGKKAGKVKEKDFLAALLKEIETLTREKL
ncbi:MAG: flavodoxin-dependent (E)-4-hydroxy-3-methylbut-2-enyl-diphosphate synthase [Candidatus Eisenbacteria bacterium]|nr:flavodoxin-dependent (E)-4-hydroxy-3-methylbut-2-enyl-diphosphate synthase [Candidatus Eisenbacteria bacterium]